jgi:hypothetical protein
MKRSADFGEADLAEASEDPIDDLPFLSDVESAINVILSRIPSPQTRYPMIIMKHQLLPIIQNPTEVSILSIALFSF